MNVRKSIFRTKFLVDPAVQLSVSSAYFMVVTTAALFMALTARALFTHMNQLGLQINLYAGHPYFKQVEMASQVFYHRLFIGLILSLIVGMALSVLISHRMVGPILRLRQYFEEIHNSHELPEKPLSFREGDFFADIPNVVNGALINLKAANPIRDR